MRPLILAWRGVQVDSRRRATYVLRLVLVTSFLVALSFVSEQVALFGAPGRDFLASIYRIDVLAICAMACTVFATTITEEKDLQTLGLLRLAGYGRVSILLGKSARELVAILILLLVQVPFVLLSVTLGGVSTSHALGLFAVLGAFALFAGALGVCASTVFTHGRAASSVTCLALFLYSVLPTWIPALTGWSPLVSVAYWLRDVSVWRAFGRLAAGPADAVWPIVAGHLLMAAVIFAIAWLAFDRRNATDRPAAPARSFGLGRRATARVQGPALVWKDTRFMVGGWFGIGLRFLVYGLTILFFLLWFGGRSQLGPENVGMVMMLIGTVGGALDACLYAGRMYREEIQWGTLPLLLAVPTSSLHVVAHKLAPVLWILMPGAACTVMGGMLAPRRLTDILDEPIIVGYVFAMFAAAFTLTLHISLRLRRGAFAVAVGSVVLGHSVFFMFVAAMGPGVGRDIESCIGWTVFLVGAFALLSLVGLDARLRRMGGRL